MIAQRREWVVRCRVLLLFVAIVFLHLAILSKEVTCFVLPRTSSSPTASHHRHGPSIVVDPSTAAKVSSTLFALKSSDFGNYNGRARQTNDRSQQQQQVYNSFDSSSSGSRNNLQTNKKNRQNKDRTTSSNRDDQLIRVIDSIIYFDGDEDASSWELVEALRALKSARSVANIQRAGQRFTDHLIDQASKPVQERLLKALALAGLIHSATSLLNRLLDQGYIPSYISYTAVLSVLKRAGRIDQMSNVLHKLVQVCQRQQQALHISAFNIYLGALCENPSTLEQAAQLVLQPEKTYEEFGVSPMCLASYNTVLNGASKVGNETLVDILWESLSNSKILQPETRSYNALLQATNSYAKRLDIWNQLKATPGLEPDRYTIDLMLLPLLQNEGMGVGVNERRAELDAMLSAFCGRQPESVVKDSFAAYMTTLIQNFMVEEAQLLFDRHMAPLVEPKTVSSSLGMWKVFDSSSSQSPNNRRADTRLFNVLLEGYRKQATNAKISAACVPMGSEDNKDAPDKESLQAQQQQKLQSFLQQVESARLQGRNLLRRMEQAQVPVDAYTLTSLIGLCRSTEELVDLLTQPAHDSQITDAVVRAAITASGELGDVSLACLVFDLYGGSSKYLTSNPRLWNVLLGALADAAELGNPIIQGPSKAATSLLKSEGAGNDLDLQLSMTTMLQGRTCSEAAQELLHVMSDQKVEWAPPPNAQSFCLVAAALQYDTNASPDLAMSLFRNSTAQGISTDGRFVNAIFRCFGGDIDQALAYWKTEIRPECLQFESSRRRGDDSSAVTDNRSPRKNLIAAYNGLLHVCGRAQRPDVGLRLAYAMNREGIEPNEITLNHYKAGKRLGSTKKQEFAPKRSFLGNKLSLPKLNMVDQYENLLYVECSKYNHYNKRMAKDQRVRIIV